MAHIVLPAPSGPGDVSQPTKYVTTAVPLMLDEMVALGAKRADVYAQAAGGARMLALDALGNIGARNVDETRAVLQQHDIPLVAELVGGTKGRTLWWDLARGQAVVRRVGVDDEILTPAKYVYGEVCIDDPNFGR